MNLTDDQRRKLRYHARMLALSVLGAATLVLVFLGVTFLMLWLGVWHIEDR